MMTADDVKREREARECAARAIAESLPIARYYAADNEVRNEATHEVAFEAASHWDACLVMMAAHNLNEEDHADAYGRTGQMDDCGCCCGCGLEYGETCLTCGGFGWVRA